MSIISGLDSPAGCHWRGGPGSKSKPNGSTDRPAPVDRSAHSHRLDQRWLALPRSLGGHDRARVCLESSPAFSLFRRSHRLRTCQCGGSVTASCRSDSSKPAHQGERRRLGVALGLDRSIHRLIERVHTLHIGQTPAQQRALIRSIDECSARSSAPVAPAPRNHKSRA